MYSMIIMLALYLVAVFFKAIVMSYLDSTGVPKFLGITKAEWMYGCFSA